MPITLPEPVAAYFAADQNDGNAVALCFTENAIVVDERQTHRGRDAIRRWKTEASGKFSYTADPFAVSEEGGQTVVTAHVAGNFPGSPVDLRYAFVLEGEKIARLEITP
ncbi:MULTISPECIES: nuclear transport factor 2 family protein [unclassified Shinella]|uniref:nuclear transport factor 2 family protein n=1 Tax=unclassified Shinella TaxID=2643062 RepID=UPI00225CEC2A|nr:nuclear transport factor 2 family protein [Shinella sp. YE25]MDC7254574.1 nuclear transport factor 2 family protein [Shinella sp. YE25]CAI0337295.1 Polyketide cyclase [Rhizobiaceae bacterium]CAK7255790.1 Polyketide cyclase [Shinella sp. WSC3-e]